MVYITLVPFIAESEKGNQIDYHDKKQRRYLKFKYENFNLIYREKYMTL